MEHRRLHDMVGGADLNGKLHASKSLHVQEPRARPGNRQRRAAGAGWNLAPPGAVRVPTPPDTTLKAKLEAEAGRILQWALDAPIEQPTMPVELRLAAEAVRDEQNPVRRVDTRDVEG